MSFYAGFVFHNSFIRETDLLFRLGATSITGANAGGFSRRTVLHPHAKAINYVKAEGIVAGNPDGTYKPDQNISRVAFTKIVVETYFSAEELSQCSTGATSFSDVDSGAWFAPYICVAAKNNLVAGYPDGTFRPGDNVNLVEAAKIISAHRKGEQIGAPWYQPYLDDVGMAGAIPTQVNVVDQNVSRGL